MDTQLQQFKKAVKLWNNGSNVAALEIAEELANKGHIKSMILCADIYFRNNVIEGNIDKAKVYLEKAISMGSNDAEEILELIEKTNDIDVQRYLFNTNSV